MAMNCGMECVKYLLFVFNFIFAVCGLAILTVGVIFHLKINDISTAMQDGFPPSIPIGLIIVGAVIFVIAFFGCCGAIRDSHCMVVTFAVFLLTILVIQVAIAVYAYIQKVDEVQIKKTFRDDIFIKYWSPDKISKDIVDTIQATLSCCGVEGPTDYQNFANRSVPSSCCHNPPDVACDAYGHNTFRQGCGEEIAKLFSKALQTLGGVAIGVAVIELLGIIFSLCLANAIRNDERRGYRV